MDDADLQNFQPLDRGRINLLDPLEVRYWCRQFDCKPEELKKAVALVGDHAADVREHLSK
nr:DUF3606 domain-containing protein [Caldimonas brevitalea]